MKRDTEGRMGRKMNGIQRQKQSKMQRNNRHAGMQTK